MKRCSKCGVEKLEAGFSKNAKQRSGLHPSCRECTSKLGKLSRAAHKEARAEYKKRWREANREVIREKDKLYYKSNKSTIAEYQKVYYEINRESRLEYSRQRRIDNPEIDKRYYEANRAAALEQCKKYYRAHKDSLTAYAKRYRLAHPWCGRLYYANHKETFREYGRQWCANNPGKRVISAQKYRSKKAQLPNSLTAEQWGSIKEAFDGKCCYCGEEKPLAQEHFVALSKGGEYTHNNIVPACKSCNSSKRDKDFFIWFEEQSFYSKRREQKILKYLNYKNKIQQFSLSF